MPESGPIEYIKRGRVSTEHNEFKHIGYKDCLLKMLSHSKNDQEFTHTFWQNALTTNIYRDLFPPIMAAIRNIGRLRDGVDSFPVFLTVTDITPGAGRHTDVIAAAEYVKYIVIIL